ncbi:unnamed protein product, partial [marine sediment metagenome]
GVTIRYHDGRPLGMLVGAVRRDRPRATTRPRTRPQDEPQDEPSLLSPFEIGTGTTHTPPASGTLYLKINDSPGELHDNAGRLEVRVSGS